MDLGDKSDPTAELTPKTSRSSYRLAADRARLAGCKFRRTKSRCRACRSQTTEGNDGDFGRAFSHERVRAERTGLDHCFSVSEGMKQVLGPRWETVTPSGFPSFGMSTLGRSQAR